MSSDIGESEFQRQEYLALSEQKAADFRTITAAVPTLFTASGAIFVAGVTQAAAYAVVLAPIPMLLAVYQMAQNSRLQLTMSSFLAVSSPTSGFSFEEHASKVRKRVWEARRWDRGIGVLQRPSAYITWLKVTVLLGIVIDAFPGAAGLSHWPQATVGGVVLLVAGAAWVWHVMSQIEGERATWTDEWRRERATHSR
jgi:hypothetical protein